MPLKTDDILKIMREIIQCYEDECKDKPAGHDGLIRKLNFDQLLEQHQNSSAEYLLVKIYDFYIDDHAFNSRLLRYIEDGLIKLICTPADNEFISYRKCSYLKEVEQLAQSIDNLRIEIAKPTELKLIC